MKTNFKTIIITSISLLVAIFAPIQTVQSCASEADADSYQVAFFNPEILNSASLVPFYYTSRFLNGEIASPEQDYLRNSREWQKALGKSVSIGDVYTILYETDSDAFINAVEGGTLTTSFLGNSFATALAKTENKAILDYFVIAKEAEFAHFANSDPWGLASNTTSYSQERKRVGIIKRIETNLAKAKTDFLKERYAYQLVVHYRYTNQYEACIETFDTYFDTKNRTVLAPWALLHKAFALARTGKGVESNYALSQVFAQCESKRVRALVGFNENKIPATLDLAKSNREKANVEVLSAVNYPGRSLEKLKLITNLDKKNKFLPLLIQREINKLEDWILTPMVTGYAPTRAYDFEDYNYKDYPANEVTWSMSDFTYKNHQKDLVYLREMRGFVEQIFNTNVFPKQKDFLRLAIAHLYFMDSQPKMAQRYINQISKKAPKTILAQKHIENILVQPQVSNITSASTKQKLYESLSWLYENGKILEKPERLIAQLHLYLSKAYLKKGDVTTAGLLHYETEYTSKNEYYAWGYYSSIHFYDQYGTIEDIDKTLAFLKQKHKTNFEKYIVTLKNYEHLITDDNDTYYWINEGKIAPLSTEYSHRLIELQGTKAFRTDDLEAALSYFSKLPEDYWATTYEFRHYLSRDPVLDIQSFPWDRGEKIECNKTETVKRIIDLKAKVATDPTANYLLGNAYFNFTYWGESWMMFAYGNSTGELSPYSDFNWFSNNKAQLKAYYHCSRAVDFYKKTVDTVNDEEIKAKASLMLAYCDDRSHEAEYDKKGIYNYGKDKYVSPLYADWVKKYRETTTFVQVEGCPLLADYAQ